MKFQWDLLYLRMSTNKVWLKKASLVTGESAMARLKYNIYKITAPCGTSHRYAMKMEQHFDLREPTQISPTVCAPVRGPPVKHAHARACVFAFITVQRYSDKRAQVSKSLSPSPRSKRKDSSVSPAGRSAKRERHLVAMTRQLVDPQPNGTPRYILSYILPYCWQMSTWSLVLTLILSYLLRTIWKCKIKHFYWQCDQLTLCHSDWLRSWFICVLDYISAPNKVYDNTWDDACYCLLCHIISDGDLWATNHKNPFVCRIGDSFYHRTSGWDDWTTFYSLFLL